MKQVVILFALSLLGGIGIFPVITIGAIAQTRFWFEIERAMDFVLMGVISFSLLCFAGALVALIIWATKL